jgi:2-polyprenyl-3-methyl-5-hydroxy-6-metoxy-1,4-benzoquinol methylase
MDYDKNKPPQYFTGTRVAFVDALRTGPDASILEIGCSNGGTGALALEKGKCARYVGVDIALDALSRAKRVLTETHYGNVETMELPWEPKSFDALVISEVLEHLVDPWSTLKRLSSVLKPGAQLLAGSPNIANLSVIRALLRGRFDYEDHGVMDRTHLRWFTPQTYCEMIEGAGFRVEQCLPVNTKRLSKPKARIFNRLTGGRFEHLLWTQIAVYAVKKT